MNCLSKRSFNRVRAETVIKIRLVCAASELSIWADRWNWLVAILKPQIFSGNFNFILPMKCIKNENLVHSQFVAFKAETIFEIINTV